jgi:outer membrane protein OmpA-like peptidoglycan-associated protein
MSAFRSLLGLLAVAGLGAACAAPARAETSAAQPRTTLAVMYVDDVSTSVDLVGPLARHGHVGRADITRHKGATRIHLRLESLPHPQALGAFYTTYVLWAIAPEGQAANVAEIPYGRDGDLDATTAFQTFGLIVTAEPHSAVRQPGGLLVAENVARESTRGHLQTSRIEYSGVVGLGPGSRYHRDYKTPLLVLGAQRAVDLAQEAGAAEFAPREMEDTAARLESLERARPRGDKLPKDLQGAARDVMRTAEHARELAEQGREQARLEAERRTSDAQVAAARAQRDDARDRAEQERRNSAEARADAARARDDAERADSAKQLALLQADQARDDASRARREKEDLQQRLFSQISTILETRREARGLIVSLSDVLFDFDRASLTPGAREKLSRLAGILAAYPGSYHMGFEGHTDSIGSKEYNLGLSVGRAESVRSYLLETGVPSPRMGQAIGFGDGRPVASNATPEGRQMNRRVEIVIEEVNQ